jgi:hypothetical protein
MTVNGILSNIRADILNNRLYCTFSEISTPDGLTSLLTDMKDRVPDLKPGFDVVEDMSCCRHFQLAALPALRNIMHYLVSCGAREVIRVVDQHSTVFRQLINLSTRIRSYKPIYVNTLAEAEELLNQAQRRQGLRFNLQNTWIAVHNDTQVFNGKAVDVSASGCAILTDTETLPLGSNVRIKLPLKSESSGTLAFEISATVVRLFDGGFAVNFFEFDGATKEELMNCLIFELQQKN